MAASYLGGVTVAASVPGATAQLDALAGAIAAFRDTVNAQLTVLAGVGSDLRLAVDALVTAEGSVNAQAQAVLDAKIAIRIPAIADYQAGLDAAISVGLGLNAQLTDPTAYLSGLLSGIVEVQANLAILVPTVALGVQLDASAQVALEFEAKIAAVDLQLEALVTIEAELALIRQALADIRANVLLASSAVAKVQAAIAAALRTALTTLNAYAVFAGIVAAGGIHAFLYDGALSGLGAAVDAIASASTGLAGATTVRVPLVIVDAVGNPIGLAGVNAVFKVA